ncbi:helix-turn-helix domain-containing protein [Mycobacterium sp. MS1601]|uniref:helix-turn-helix domain-containing protein n=1 Tax=Mycobacterium sp. MS1601 TaxID=1936029 RepID=UPI0012F835DC|nr:AraC family transcriptional regulator [Mycobacterium sp. MS1601]
MGITFVAGTPHSSLRGVVLRYEGFSDRSGQPVTFRELPCSYVPIIVDLDTGWTITHVARPAMRLGSFVAGVTESPVLVHHGGNASCLQVDLTPLGARRLLGVPMHELANQTIAVEDVLGAAELGWSHKRLIKRYRDTVGLPPKTVARIVRFEKLTSRLGRGDVDWAALAADCGFFDQAHLAREVRSLAGQTPTELLVNFVQDAAVPSV